MISTQIVLGRNSVFVEYRIHFSNLFHIYLVYFIELSLEYKRLLNAKNKWSGMIDKLKKD